MVCLGTFSVGTYSKWTRYPLHFGRLRCCEYLIGEAKLSYLFGSIIELPRHNI